MASVSSHPEVDEALSRLAHNSAVRGLLVLDRSKGFVIKSRGALFDAEAEDHDAVQRYAQRAWKLVEATQEEIEGLEDGDIVRFLRIRTKRHELLITPDSRFVLVVVQDPSSREA